MMCGVFVCLLFLILLGFTLSYPGTYYYHKYYYTTVPNTASITRPVLVPYPYIP